MKPELLEQLQHHKGLAKTKAETEESLRALRKQEEEEYLLARNNIFTYLLKPAWAKAMALMREADFIVEEQPVTDDTQEEFHLTISSPHSSKPPRTLTLGFDDLHCYVYLDGKKKSHKSLAPYAGVEELVELIIDMSIGDLGPYAISLPNELYKSKYYPLPVFRFSVGDGTTVASKQVAARPGKQEA